MDLYNGSGGNNIALELILLGMKLTPVNPGFVDARDAILRADEAIYGGANACIIWEAFAKRGLGYGADQGSSENIFDGTESDNVPDDCICCYEFVDWDNYLCPANTNPGWILSTVYPPNKAYEYRANNYVCLAPGFMADAQNNLAFLANVGYCIPQSNPLRLGDNIIQSDLSVSIYPNPFSKQTTIEFEVDKENEVSIFVTDILGKSVGTVANKSKKQAGKHHLTFDGSNLPVGIYYCTIKAGDKIKTQKLIITK